MFALNQIPIFQKLEDSKNVLVAGAGGGFDIFSGIPLLSNLAAQGKKLILANYAFTRFEDTTSKQVFPFVYEVKAGDANVSDRDYFPEKYLKLWMSQNNFDQPVYGFNRCGIQPLKEAYEHLIEKHQIDAVVLVDGGTDSLMFGDEGGLGTPHEDMCSMSAVNQCDVKEKLLLAIGFGIDHFHGVSHFRFLENVAQVDRDGGFLGTFQVLKEMVEGRHFNSAVEFANQHMSHHQSIVANSVNSALQGDYGNVHATDRTRGSELWINPLMTIYWCFELEKVMARNKYYDRIKDTNTVGELNEALMEYRETVKSFREHVQIPI